jgi:hypothetical protein
VSHTSCDRETSQQVSSSPAQYPIHQWIYPTNE